MIKIKLQPTGRKKNIFYRVVAMERRSKRDGRVLEQLGFITKVKGKKEAHIDKTKLKLWVGKGAQITEGVRKFI